MIFMILVFAVLQGNIAYTEIHWQKAVNLYTEAIKLNEENATYYSNRAAAYLELGRYFIEESVTLQLL